MVKFSCFCVCLMSSLVYCFIVYGCGGVAICSASVFSAGFFAFGSVSLLSISFICSSICILANLSGS